MAKKSKFGISTAPRDKPKKRPGRHKKSRNKQEKRQQKNPGISEVIRRYGFEPDSLRGT